MLPVIYDSAHSSLLQSRSMHCIAGDSLRSAHGFNGTKKWPCTLWFLLQFVGLLNSRRVVTKRQCHICHIQQEELGELMTEEEVEVEEDVTTENHESNASSEPCLACQSEWRDARGRYLPYSGSEIGAWNHCVCTFLSLVLPLAMCLLSVYDVILHGSTSMGNSEQQFRIVSYIAYKLFTSSIPAVILTANVSHFVLDLRKPLRRLGSSWYTTLNVRFIVKHLQHLKLGERGLPRKPFLAVCLIWPFLTGLYNSLYYFDRLDALIKVTVFNEIACMLMYGVFCYLMCLLRLAFQKELPLELAFLRRHAGALDVCRRRMALYAEALLCICRFVSSWMLFVIVVSTWAICTEISWDYKRLVHFGEPDGEVVAKTINLIAWSEDLMFLTLPLLAIGGVGLNDTWVEFKRSISEMRSETHEMFWDKILIFCNEQSPVCSVATHTLIFSATGLFFGLKFDDEVKGLWPNIALNRTGL